ncbi:DNA cytosine methyltransferase [Sphingosinicella sp. BN140058]|uniref:DNA cytosine methyltransferase n=1 Tax=Sphingosinicella sp. BN140058 TaxID=1892855 RepID=UPI001013951E|nr:DNA cytosine methyltransferase [Sphingosinicella sp. BN140058]QAY80441.1 DNA cytosine methyltransferase [Sphingosinicella sp. BN140058]
MTHDLPTRRGALVDLFAGAGGGSLGFEQAGFDINVAVDNEPVNTATHDYLFSYGRALTLDLMKNQEKAIRAALPTNADVDCLAVGRPIETILGGPPCPGISSIGKRDPNDSRNLLMGSFIEHATGLGAKMIVMEQVPTLLQQQNAWILDDIRERLHRAGYSLVEPRVLRAIDFGVPQRRERVFLLIHRNDCQAPEYPQPTHGEGGDMWLHPTPTVGDAFDGLPDADEFPELWHQDWAEAGFTAPTSRYGRMMTGLENDADDLSYKRDHRRGQLTCSQLTVHEAKSIERFSATAPGGNEKISRRHRLDPAGLSLTLRAGSNADHGSFTAVVPIHTKGTRVITAREACRLHSIPDWFRLSRIKILAYRQCGNSIPPLLARAVGKQVMKALELAPAAPSEVIPLGNDDLLNVNNSGEQKLAA